MISPKEPEDLTIRLMRYVAIAFAVYVVAMLLVGTFRSPSANPLWLLLVILLPG